MTRENLARKFRPAGFEQPEGDRHDYTKPRPELQEAFKRWVDGLPKHISLFVNDKEEYEKASELIEPLGEIPYKEANALLIDFKPKRRAEETAGLFISACYNRSPEPVIIFDGDLLEIEYIGSFLSGKKVLVNNGGAGDSFGRFGRGTIINNGDAGSFNYIDSNGIKIENGEERIFVVKVRICPPILYEKGRLCAPYYTTPKSRAYLEELDSITKAIKDDESAKRFIERYGIGGYKIPREIEELRKEAVDIYGRSRKSR